MEKRIKLGGAKASSPWTTLDSNILLMIFNRLPIYELFFQISIVCSSWRSTFWDLLFSRNYNTLDLTSIRDIVARKYGLGLYQYRGDYLSTQYATTIERFVNEIFSNPRVLRGDERVITTLILPRYMNLSPSNLTLISQLTPSLKKLELQGSHVLKASCRFDEAVEHWKSLEHVSIGPILKLDMDPLIQVLGTCCGKLRTMNIDMGSWHSRHVFILLSSTSDWIAENLDQLEEISLTRVSVAPRSVSRLLVECKNLLTLYMNRCRFEKNDGRNIITNKVSRSSKTAITWRLDSTEEVLSCDELVDHLFS